MLASFEAIQDSIWLTSCSTEIQVSEKQAEDDILETGTVFYVEREKDWGGGNRERC